jgi:putative glutamine amidotransferase
MEKALFSRPIVGITCYEEAATWGNWNTEAAVLPVSYIRAVTSSGGIPVLLPPQELTDIEADRVIERLDGLVLAGGGDVAPIHYGAVADPNTVVAGGARDALELAAVRAATGGEIPTLAICRGLQVLNVARGGTLIQHLPPAVGHDRHSPTPGEFGEHEVRIEQGTQLASILSWDRGAVPTHHHQAIDRLGAGLEAVAFADDGVVEAVEDKSVPFLIGTQWHPEAGTDPCLFEALLAAAARRCEARAAGPERHQPTE